MRFSRSDVRDHIASQKTTFFPDLLGTGMPTRGFGAAEKMHRRLILSQQAPAEWVEPLTTRASGYVLTLHEPVTGCRLLMQRERIEMVRLEDIGKSLIASTEADACARRQIDPQPACAHMYLPVGGNGLYVADDHLGTRDDRTLCAGIVGRHRVSCVGPGRQPTFLVLEGVVAEGGVLA